MTTRLGDSNVVFGVTDDPWGYMQNVKLDHSPQLAEAQRGDGEVIAGEFFKNMKKCSGEYIYRNVSGDPLALCGTNTAISITDAGVSIYITSANKSWQMGEWCKISFEGNYYPNLGS